MSPVLYLYNFRCLLFPLFALPSLPFLIFCVCHVLLGLFFISPCLQCCFMYPLIIAVLLVSAMCVFYLFLVLFPVMLFLCHFALFSYLTLSSYIVSFKNLNFFRISAALRGQATVPVLCYSRWQPAKIDRIFFFLGGGSFKPGKPAEQPGVLSFQPPCLLHWDTSRPSIATSPLNIEHFVS